MAEEMNVITANFTEGQRNVVTDPLYAVDYGQILRITGLELPEFFTVHFAKDGETATEAMGTFNDGVGEVEFINSQIETGGTVVAYIYLHTGENDGETEYKVTTRVIARPKVTNSVTPEQQSALDQAIDALNDATEQMLSESVTFTDPNSNGNIIVTKGGN